MTTCARERTAIHEAGHVVAAWSVGLEVGVVQLHDPGGGGTLISRLSELPPPIGELAWRLSGPGAEVVPFGSYDMEGARLDRAGAIRSVHELIGPVDFEALEGRVDPALSYVADRLLRPRWSQVEEIAGRLLVNRVLYRDDLADLPRPPAFDVTCLRQLLGGLEVGEVPGTGSPPIGLRAWRPAEQTQ